METINKTTNYDFTASFENVKSLYSVLKAINFQESATFQASGQGLKVTVEQSKCVQATAYVPSDNFWEFHVARDIEFKINLTVLTECLNIFGSDEDSSLKMYYKNEGSPLILLLENKSKDLTGNDEFVTDCEIKTQETDELMYFKGDDDVTECAMVVFKSLHFMNIIGDFDKSSEVVEFRITSEHPHICISTFGNLDRSSVEIPKSSEVVVTFSCAEDAKFKYKFSQIRLMLKSLALASKVALKIDSRGLLIVQHMLDKEENRQMFIEFYITPLLEDDDI